MDQKQQRQQTQHYFDRLAEIGRQSMAQTRQQQQEQRMEAKPARDNDQERRTHGR